MTFSSTTHVGPDDTTIRLVGELDGRAAGGFNDVIVEAAARPMRRLVLLMDELTYMSSAGLRCLVFAQQKLEQGTEIVLVGTREEVAETIRLTGFDQSVTMRETADS